MNINVHRRHWHDNDCAGLAVVVSGAACRRDENCDEYYDGLSD